MPQNDAYMCATDMLISKLADTAAVVITPLYPVINYD